MSDAKRTPQRTIMNVAVDPRLRERFNAICFYRGQKKSFILTKIITDFIETSENEGAKK